MLALTRRPKQCIMIGDDIIVYISEVRGDNVRMAIEAPRDVKIFRGEIYAAIQEENKKAAEIPTKLNDALQEELPTTSN